MSESSKQAGRGADEEDLRIEEVERDLVDRSLALGFGLLKVYVAKLGFGDAGETLQQEDGSIISMPGRTARRRWIRLVRSHLRLPESDRASRRFTPHAPRFSFGKKFA